MRIKPHLIHILAQARLLSLAVLEEDLALVLAAQVSVAMAVAMARSMNPATVLVLWEAWLRHATSSLQMTTI